MSTVDGDSPGRSTGTSRGAPLRPDDPRQLGPYRLVSVLGEGGMGRVYLGHAADDRPVAVKVISAHLADDVEFRRRFRSEVERARQVPSFSTAEVIDADPDHDPPYLVVEFIDGPSLAEAVAREGPLAASDLRAIAIGVAAALRAIHDAGVIHRDLKPGNVLLARGSPKVIDFGLARPAVNPATFTRPGDQLGTIPYMAPERFYPAERQSVTAAADIFAWGAVVTFAGTGRIPFAGDSTGAVVGRIIHGTPDLTGLTDPLRGLVERALAKDPAARPTARQLMDRLTAAGGPDVGDPVPGTGGVWRRRLPRGRRLLLVPAGLLAIAAGAVPLGAKLMQPGPGATAAQPSAAPASRAPDQPSSQPASAPPAPAPGAATQSSDAARTPAAPATRPRPGTPSPAPRRSSECLGAERVTLDAADTDPLPELLCLSVGAVLEVRNIGPGDLSLAPESHTACAYEAGIIKCRFIRTGPVEVTLAVPGPRSFTVLVVQNP